MSTHDLDLIYARNLTTMLAPIALDNCPEGHNWFRMKGKKVQSHYFLAGSQSDHLEAGAVVYGGRAAKLVEVAPVIMAPFLVLLGVPLGLHRQHGTPESVIDV